MYLVLHNELANAKYMYIEVRASQLAQASERVGSLIPASQQGCKVFNPVVKLVLENQPFLMPEPAEKPSLRPAFDLSLTVVSFSRISY